ncbi:hypothetical protein Tco_0392459 [Tanacetum coccineum]
MSKANPQITIVSEEQLVPHANILVIKKNNQRVASNSDINDTMLRFVVGILRHHKLYKTVSLTTTVLIIYLHQFWTTINHNANSHTFTFELDTHTFTLTPGLLRIVLQIYDEDPNTKMIDVSKMVATRLHQPWRAILSVLNRSLTGKDSSWDTVKLKILQILWGIVHSANLDFASLVWDEFEWKTFDRSSRPSKMSKLLYTRFTKLIINHFLSCNKSITHRSNSKLHSAQDDQPITKLSNIVKGDYKFRMEILDTMISDAIKKSAGYNHYIAKRKETVNVPKKDDVPRKTRSIPIAKETVVVQSLLDLQKRSKASRLESLKQKKQTVVGEGLNTTEEINNKTDDADNFDMDLSYDNPNGDDDDDARFGVFMYNKSTKTPKYTYFSPKVTNSSLDFIQNLLNETPANELTDFVSNPIYTNAQTTSAVIYLEGNTELTSYISGASEVPLGTHVDVQATNVLLQEMFPDENAHHIPYLLIKKIPYTATTPQPSSLQAKAKKLMQKAKKNMRKINFKKASITLDQEVLNAQDEEPSFYKRSHDNQDPLNNREGENRKKRRKDVGEPYSRSLTRNKSPMFPKKSGSANAKRRTTLFDLLLKSDIDQNENHILGPSIVAIAKKLKALIQKDELTTADLEGAELKRLKPQYQNNVELEYHVDQLKEIVLSEAKWNNDEDDVSKPRSFERHMSKNTKPHPSFYNNDFYYLVSLSTEEKYTASITKHYDERYYIQDSRIDFFKAEMSNRSEGKVNSDLRIKSVVRIVMVKKIDQTLKRRERLKRLEEYVGGRPKTVNPRTFVRPM